MRIRQTGRYLTLTVESDTERSELLAVAGDVAGQHYRVDTINEDGLTFRAAGPSKPEPDRPEPSEPGTAQSDRDKFDADETDEADDDKSDGDEADDADAPPTAQADFRSTFRPTFRAEPPINITFDETPMPLRLISNLAETSFELDGRWYSSVEGFWQGLKFADAADRERLAELAGHSAKSAGPKVEPGDRIVYEGREVVVGTVDHWALMERANTAKFEQDEDARAALLSTGTSPLIHQVAVDSRTIPGIVMADIWMRIREELADE